MNKIITFEGKIYEIGKYYLFSNNKSVGWHVDAFDCISQNRDYKFKSKENKYRHIKKIPESWMGVIKDIPDLINGASYMFDIAGSVNICGVYYENTDRIYVALGRNMSPDYCTNIREMVVA
jgi:hypothetical protein|tara:strand:+ start:105 stop:467 length:363 start_codon:yes stop_codon:yes gene_type:complete